MSKIAIIGGGLSGLTAAAYLSKDHEVTLLEKNKDLGGRARVLKTKEGFIFDMGPSWYMMPDVIEQIFNELGYSTQDFFTLKELDPKYKVFKDDQTLTIVSDLNENLQQFKRISPEDSKKIKTLLAKTHKSYTLSVQHFLQKPYLGITDFLSVKDIYLGVQLLSQFNPFQTYHSFIQKHIKNPTLQQIFEFHTVFLGGSPHNSPALYAILIAADFYKKIWYPMGGMGELVASLETICRKQGVKIKTNQEVQEIITKDTKITAVRTQNAQYKTDLVVSSADYAHTELDLLKAKQRTYAKKYWDQKEYSISSVLLYIGLNKKLKNVEHHTFYFQDNWDTHFNQIEKTTKLPNQPNFYLSVASKTDPNIAPKGHEALFILVPISVQTNDTQIESYAEKIITHVETKIGEQFNEAIIYKKIYGKKDFMQDYNAYKGNALGLAHTLKQSVFLRPQMKSKKVKNLYYIGQFTQPGVGVPTVMLSGKYIADMIRREYE